MSEIQGFSKLTKTEKIEWLSKRFQKEGYLFEDTMKSFWLLDDDLQKVMDGFSENTISNFFMPYGIAPNFLINNRKYTVPMVIEESSVVAAASAGAKYWAARGGITADVMDTEKVGQVHFRWQGDLNLFDEHRSKEMDKFLRKDTEAITVNMRARGGGVKTMELRKTQGPDQRLYQLFVTFETCDSMGANFINSVLEQFSKSLSAFVASQTDWPSEARNIDILMSILSNYTPDCLVRAEVHCPIDDLMDDPDMASKFARDFMDATYVARNDPYRAVTHNKGIFNGVDAVLLATGNDFRAVEACGHAFAARSGQYRGLSECKLEDDSFSFWLELPLAVGTVGGLTKLHPLAKSSLELLEYPSAKELMCVIASVGLVQNFMALRSLVTTGIQKGHMKLHLQNILNHLEATEDEKLKISQVFENRVVSFSEVRKVLDGMRAD